MRWIHDYQLFLFDFDGLLVNTEEIHFKAYQRMCASFGFELGWDFDRYCQTAHYESERLRDGIYASLPELKKQQPSWEVLYAIKKKAILDLFKEGTVHMMPGAEKLLNSLQANGINRCVVTHSSDDLVKSIRNQNPILNSIPHWITREDYTHPKPNPECYNVAISRLAKPGDRIIGFEDTPRGMIALLGSSAQPILICQAHYPEIPSFIQKGVRHYPSLEAIVNLD
jgi:beta-phosphoglucomutase